MCIIAIKSPNKKFMSKSILQECFTNNPDGAGFMFSDGECVHIKKGYMTFKSFWSALKGVRAKYGDDIGYVMHFRISTQAGVQPSCTHPFPLSKNMKDLKLLSSKAKVGIAHNGIIQLTTDHSQKEYSDTMKFITDYVPFFIKNLNWWQSEPAKKALKELCGSKLAILGADGHIERIGDFVEHQGNYYSNTTFQTPKIKYSYTLSTSKYDWYDDGYGYRSCAYGGGSDDWELYWSETRQEYVFNEEWCPMDCDDEDCYCDFCSNRGSCPLFKNLVNEDETPVLKVSKTTKK